MFRASLFCALVAVLAAESEVLVPTPGGMAHIDCIHEVPEHAVIKTLKNGHALVYDETGRHIQTLPPCSYGKQRGPQAQGNGWQAWTWDKHSTAIDVFNGTFSIPSVPSNPNGQLLYIFTALQNTCCGEGQCTNATMADPKDADYDAVCDIIQPVLQFGPGPAGGQAGEWCIANWYIAPNGRYIHNTCTKVTPGGSVFGAMVQRSGTWELFFNEKKSGGANLSMKITGIEAPPPQMVAYVTLETYNAFSCEQYPTGGNIKFTDMTYEAGGKKYEPKWTSTRAYDNCKQHAFINSPESVDIRW
eukprot:TRINITY_DN46326_c0_g2_i1.p1 TRINITY_DN46326_c0_g2~~TRINITY_DN46326_c0_g2_i1.p1  ORF type:complete len:302 (+),score=53.01 TRINITY_DN46326_c0_g2_i1:40-945(+)